MSDPYDDALGAAASSSRSDSVIAALVAAVDALVPAVGWIARQVRRLAMVAALVGLLLALLLDTFAPGAAVVVGIVAAGCVVVFGWYWFRLRQFVASAPALRAEIRQLKSPVDARVALDAAERHLGHGSFMRRIQAAETISGTLGENSLAARAGTIRRQLLPSHVGFVGWAVAITVVLVLSLPLVALIALFAS